VPYLVIYIRTEAMLHPQFFLIGGRKNLSLQILTFNHLLETEMQIFQNLRHLDYLHHQHINEKSFM
jgi:hypothetical protein